MSDHDVVISNLDLKAKVLKNKARRVFIYSKADIVNIKRDIVNESQNFYQSNPYRETRQLRKTGQVSNIYYILQWRIALLIEL